MRRYLLALSIVAMLAATCPGEIKINVPDGPVPVGTPLQIYVDGLVQADLPSALVYHHPQTAMVLTATSWGGKPYLFFFADKPGSYGLLVAVARNGVQDSAAIEIQVGQPNPDPKPDPEPDPDPVPIPGKRWVLIVAETNQPTFQERNLLAQLRVSGQLPNLWILDPDSPDAWAKPYIDQVDKSALPQIAIIGDKDGGVIVHKQKLPATAAAVAELVKRYGG